MHDPGLVAAIIAEVIRGSETGTKVLFATTGTPTDVDRATATDIAARAGLPEWAGWTIVSTAAEPALATALDDLAETGRCAGAVIVSLDGASVVVPAAHGEGLDIAVLEVGS